MQVPQSRQWNLGQIMRKPQPGQRNDALRRSAERAYMPYARTDVFL
jgi:hypothetical protein